MCLDEKIRKERFFRKHPLVSYKGDDNKAVCWKVVTISREGSLKPAHFPSRGKTFIAKKWLNEMDFREYVERNWTTDSCDSKYRVGFHMLLSKKDCRDYIEIMNLNMGKDVRVIKCIVHKDMIVSQGIQTGASIPIIVCRDMYIPKQFILNHNGIETTKQVKTK